MSRPLVLFITLSNIGDAVLTTPALEHIHRVLPDADIDIVADRRSSQLFEHCPYRGELFLRDKRAGWAGRIRLLRELRRKHYDLVADLRTDGLAYLLRADRRLNKRRGHGAGGHAVQRHLAVVAPLAAPPAKPITRVWLDAAARGFAEAALCRLQPGRWLALGPGANWPPKIWPVDRYGILVEEVAGLFDGVIICGGAADIGSATDLMRRMSLPAVNLAGATDLLQAAAVLERARCFVGNDSGLGHLAAAVGTPTLTVFGPGEPERYHPWGECADWVVAPGRDLNALPAPLVAARLQALIDRGRSTAR